MKFLMESQQIDSFDCLRQSNESMFSDINSSHTAYVMPEIDRYMHKDEP